MQPSEPGTHVDASTPLRRSPTKPISMTWPSLLSERLDALVDILEEAGVTTNRSELAAAVVLSAPESPDELEALIKRYKTAKAADATLDAGVNPGGILTLTRHGPGPRPRRGSVSG